MKTVVNKCFKLLYYSSKIFGVSWFGNGLWFFLDTGYFVVVMIWFGGCFLYLESKFPAFYAQLSDPKGIILFVGQQIVRISGLICLLQFHSNQNEMRDVIESYRRIRQTFPSLLPSQRRRYACPVLLVFGFSIFGELMTVNYHFYTRPIPSDYLQVCCTYTIPYPIILLQVQFFGWTQFLGLVCEMSLKRLQRVSWQARSRIFFLKNNRKRVLRASMGDLRAISIVKSKILRIYGLSILSSQVRSFVGLTVYSSFLLPFGVRSIQGTYFFCRFFFCLAISYIPHWSGQMNLIKVSCHDTSTSYHRGLVLEKPYCQNWVYRAHFILWFLAALGKFFMWHAFILLLRK